MNPFFYRIAFCFSRLRVRLFPVRGKNNTISVKGRIIRLKKSIVGNGNTVRILNSTVIDSSIRIRGNGNSLVIEDGCYIGKQCSFWIEGNNNKIIIGKKTTMTTKCHFNAQEHDTSIIVGQDCMFSNTIVVRTSDSHPIFNEKGERINLPKSVVIGNHVWLAPNSVVMKGADIESGCVIGSHSMVNKNIPAKSLAVGMPAKVVKSNISWSRDNIIL